MPADLTLEPIAPPDREGTFAPGRARLVIAVLGTLAVASIVAFMTYDLQGSLSFALELRATKVAGMTLVGVSLGAATVMFHTITGNRILTPSLMGFDALYLMVQSLAAYTFGTFAFLAIDVRVRFGVELVIMVGFALLLQRVFLRPASQDIVALLLVGVVLAGMFRSLTQLVARLIDPNEYATLQDQFFANFSSPDEDLLRVAGVIIVVVLAVTWRWVGRLDVMSIGRDHAIGLGVDHARVADRTLVAVAVLVSVATALVGPITFLGLLVSNLAYRLTGTFRHRYTIPAAGLAGVVAVVGAQFLLEELLEFQTRASMIVSFVGGLYFIVLLLRESRS